MKIGPVGDKLFHADGQTHRQTYGGQADMMKLTVTLRNFGNAPKIFARAGPLNTKNKQIKLQC